MALKVFHFIDVHMTCGNFTTKGALSAFFWPLWKQLIGSPYSICTSFPITISNHLRLLWPVQLFPMFSRLSIKMVGNISNGEKREANFAATEGQKNYQCHQFSHEKWDQICLGAIFFLIYGLFFIISGSFWKSICYFITIIMITISIPWTGLLMDR